MKKLYQHGYEKSGTKAQHNNVLHKLKILPQSRIAAVNNWPRCALFQFLFECHFVRFHFGSSINLEVRRLLNLLSLSRIETRNAPQFFIEATLFAADLLWHDDS